MTYETYRSMCLVLYQASSSRVQVLLGRIKWIELYPPFLAKLIQTLQKCIDTGRDFYVTNGERTWDEQHALYLKGRRGIPGEGIVTKAAAGSSCHNYAIAADLAYDTDFKKAGLQPSWDEPHLKHMADAAIDSGLDAGFYWSGGFTDGPHIQLDIRSQGVSVKQLKAIYLKSQKLGVFEYLDRFKW